MSSTDQTATDVIRTGWDRRTALWFGGTYSLLGLLNLPEALNGSAWRIAFLVLAGVFLFGFIPFMVWKGQEAFALSSEGVLLAKRRFLPWDVITGAEIRPLRLTFLNSVAPQRVLVLQHGGEPEERRPVGWWRRRNFRMPERVYGTSFVLAESQLKGSLEDVTARLRRYQPSLDVAYVGKVGRTRPNTFSLKLVGVSLLVALLGLAVVLVVTTI